jgi:hypothetical protein
MEVETTRSIGGEGETSAYVVLGQIGEFLENVSMRHPGCQVFEDVVNSNAQAANARLTAAFTRFHRDDVQISHTATTLCENMGLSKGECAS